MIILVGCEESQAVTKEFRRKGHQAYSCDLQPCSGGHPEWHLQMDVFKAIAGGMLVTQDGKLVEIRHWDMAIFFPTCTYLTVSANRWYEDRPPLKSGKPVGAERRKLREEAVQFFLDLANCGIKKIAIENPVGIMSTRYRKPDQVIQPYFFGEESAKATCLWLIGLPKLYHSKQPDLFNQVVHVSKGELIEWQCKKTGRTKRQAAWYSRAKHGKDDDRSKERSKTFTSIARAMANAWG